MRNSKPTANVDVVTSQINKASVNGGVSSIQPNSAFKKREHHQKPPTGLHNKSALLAKAKGVANATLNKDVADVSEMFSRNNSLAGGQ